MSANKEDIHDNIPEWDAVDADREGDIDHNETEVDHFEDESSHEDAVDKKNGIMDNKLFLPAAVVGIVLIAGAGTFVTGGFGGSGPNAPVQTFSAQNNSQQGQNLDQKATIPTPVTPTPVAQSVAVTAPSVPAPAAMSAPVMAGSDPVASSSHIPDQVQPTNIGDSPVMTTGVSASVDEKRLNDLEAGNQSMSKNIAALADEINQLRQDLATNQGEVKPSEPVKPKVERKTAAHYVAKPRVVSAINGWTLSGVTEGSMAILNDKDGSAHVAHEGDSIDGLTIEKIGPDYVKTNRGIIR